MSFLAYVSNFDSEFRLWYFIGFLLIFYKGHSADKRGTTVTLHNTRGRKVIAEVTIPKGRLAGMVNWTGIGFGLVRADPNYQIGVMESVFRTTTEAFVRQRQIFGSVSGQIGSVFGMI